MTERRNLAKSVIILITATLKLCITMMVDYALYWMLSVIRRHASFQSKVRGKIHVEILRKLSLIKTFHVAPNMPGLHIQGNGILADLLRSIVKAFQPMGIQMEIDTIPCLPDPIPPDYDRYIQIGKYVNEYVQVC